MLIKKGKNVCLSHIRADEIYVYFFVKSINILEDNEALFSNRRLCGANESLYLISILVARMYLL